MDKKRMKIGFCSEVLTMKDSNWQDKIWKNAISVIMQIFFSSCLVFFSFIFFSFKRIHSNFFIIFFQSCQIFSSFRKFSFFHTFSNIPVDKSTFDIHQVKLVIQSCPSFSNSSCVAQHAYSSWHLCKISSWNDSWWLIIDTNLETCRAPINELN